MDDKHLVRPGSPSAEGDEVFQHHEWEIASKNLARCPYQDICQFELEVIAPSTIR